MPSQDNKVRTIDTSHHLEILREHGLYAGLRDGRSLRIFMEAHVFAVWDFQCLIKALQRAVTCVEVPWLPSADPEARRLMNEIVLDEESDRAPWGGYLSHLELYLVAMEECGADTAPIQGVIDDLRAGRTVAEALARPGLPPGVAAFVSNTLEVAMSGEVHRIAAAFAYGREEVIPTMFRQVVDRLSEDEPERWETFRFYLNRHIEHDEEAHGPMARALVARVCGAEERRWAEAQETVHQALTARARLWDAIQGTIVAAGVGARGAEGLPAQQGA